MKLSHNEEIKSCNPTVAGTIAEALADQSGEHFTRDDYEFLKFHGIYQQDDRDLRKSGKHYIMMVRSAIPGGVMSAGQWRTFDGLSTRYGNDSLRITTRQTIQFHGVAKRDLRAVVKGINECLLSTLAACGDVGRNVMAPPTPAYTAARATVLEDCRMTAKELKPQTHAYHSIWIDGVQLDLNEEVNRDFADSLYGKTYLPRKFKVAFAIPPSNDVDILTNDVGFIAVVEDDQLLGYNLAVGGGMGRTHRNERTYPRLADVLGFLPRHRVLDVVRAVLAIHRQFGDRIDRKHARLKYVVAERGVEWTRAEIERRAGFALDPARDFTFETMGDLYGWHKAVDGRWFLTLFVPAGRVKDVAGHEMKTALREVAEKFPSVEFRLSPNQNVILANIPESDKTAVEASLAQYGVRTDNQAGVLHLAAMACPALPTCGLALAESERMLPGLLGLIEKLCAELGLGDEEIIIRSTGCPNGCARPYVAEIGFVGKAPGRYQMWFGGNVAGTRINHLWKDLVNESEFEAELRPVLARFASERIEDERFGDFAARVLLRA